MKSKGLLLLAFSVFVGIQLQAQRSFKVEVSGKGNPVLLFPGFGCTGEVWDETVRRLSAGYECHIFTFAGFGNVPAIDTPWLSTIKDDIVSYIKTRKLRKPVLLGHSLGGTLSLWLASLETGMFSKVIVADALPASAALMIPGYNGEKLAYDNPQSKAILQMSDSAFKAMNRQAVGYMCLNKDRQQTILNWMNSCDRKTYVYGYVDMLNLDLRRNIAAITIPVTILAATFPGKQMAENIYAAQYRHLPGVRVLYADNAAHFVMYDQPEWFIDNVLKAIE
ncbi:alpha/beta hydrolase [Chitinophaga sp. Mgbs1]|uniref:Alpha/beta hydrolase n=1 Tax=Chitinophaga solisilvae TaxID=1233460 RepID=A0A433WMV2_9BACT|nr:alpha/beta hydrolase [Chitinophaga solisilvae]